MGACRFVTPADNDLPAEERRRIAETWAAGAPPSSGEDVAAFLDRFAARLARAYHAGEMPYVVCDSIAGDLWGLLQGLWLDGVAHRWPALFQEVYEAFDAGAYHRLADGSDDPVATYTDPAIAAIVARLDGAA
ncbi:hypothetical protein ASE95_07365 [Sphingomonas sp. Leaf231]|uniref:hypothetical protein n=1 Tax=Sphingomonas sp. Leaf231 TaxID=1736301 RepID=UPI0006F1ED93|nr:hypothetical protein [Sphingomonas sp. Leaf231]KQN92518.1 hypothetical protein ASE95_07365 [Sphingomonas sp. Leaf231]